MKKFLVGLLVIGSLVVGGTACSSGTCPFQNGHECSSKALATKTGLDKARTANSEFGSTLVGVCLTHGSGSWHAGNWVWFTTGDATECLGEFVGLN